MPIESTDSHTIVTGDAVLVYRALVIRRGLKLKIATGMEPNGRFRIGNVARDMIGSRTRDLRKLYAEVDAYVVSIGGESVPLPA